MPLVKSKDIDRLFLAPEFSLLGVDGNIHTLNSCVGPNGVLVMFICNHCPSVQAVLNEIIRDAHEGKKHGIGSVAIMPNDVEAYPQDSLPKMKALWEQKDANFPYLIDESQDIARKYDAVCTPDFFVFNSNLKLCYRGRIINPQTAERELFNSMVKIASEGSGPQIQHNSSGCSIKWKT